MKPILILQHLERGDVPLMMEALKPTGLESVTLRPDLGEPLPEPQDLQSFSGLCFCGGTQSVNDDYPWIAQELDLIRYAAEIDMPVIGHCLGGQLISAALGGITNGTALSEARRNKYLMAMAAKHAGVAVPNQCCTDRFEDVLKAAQPA